MRRREFITLLGSAAAWPLAGRAQQVERVRRIGVLMFLAADDAEGQARIAAFLQKLQQFGWTDGRNLRIEYRWGAGDADRIRRHAADLAALAPDVIIANSEEATAALQRETRNVPVVFVGVGDPVASRFVAGLSRPGGNMTGFTVFEYSTAGKWLELLRENVPPIVRAVVIYHGHAASSPGFLRALESAAQSLGMQLTPAGVGEAAEIEHTIDTFARQSNGGLVVLPSGFTAANRELIVGLAARHQLPAIYPHRYFAAAGGLASYSIDFLDLFRGAASYVDSILKGTKPTDLPVQQPTKFQLVINLKTAKVLGLEVPPMVLARADEVIE